MPDRYSRQNVGIRVDADERVGELVVDEVERLTGVRLTSAYKVVHHHSVLRLYVAIGCDGSGRIGVWSITPQRTLS